MIQYMKSIRRQFIRSLMAGAALLLALASCTIEHDMGKSGGGGDGEAFVKFSVWLLGSTPASRALTENNENHVQTIDILIFEQGGDWVYNAGCSGSDITTDGGDPLKKSFTLKMRQGAYDMVMLANARELLSEMDLTGQSKAAVLAVLNETVPTEGKWVADASDSEYIHIPMWGEIGYVTIDGDTQNLDAKDIHLTRMLARVDVQIASTAGTFRLTSVDVYNYNTMGSLVPTTTGSWNGTKSVSPNVPAGSTLTKGPLEYNNEDSKTEINTTDNKCAMEIYLFEAENHTAGGHSTAKDMLDRTCIVIGGIYGSDPEPSYYRADFSMSKDNTGDDVLDVLRNHHYTFNITKVSGSGHGTSEEAFQGANPIEFTVTVTDWGNNLNVPLTNKPEKWARSNIVWDDANQRLTFAVTQRDNETIPASSQGVFFKWGSLVAVSPVGVTYTGQILFSPSGTNNYSWLNIPYVDETTEKFATYGQEEDDFYNYNDGSNTGGPGYSSTSDKGDICRYISANGWVEGNWRLPTQAEYNALIAEIGGTEGAISNGGNFVDIPAGTPEESNKYGDTRYGYWQPVAGRWLGEGATRDAARGAAAELVPGGSSVYFVAGGFRNSDDGDLARIGLSSSLWSASSAYASTGTSANYTNINETAAIRNAASRTYGMPIRCIRDDAAPVQQFSTDYDGGETILTDGETYVITVSSNVEWEAAVESGTDAVTEGDVIGDPLLNTTTGFGGGASSAAVVRSGNNRLELRTVDYVSRGSYARGTLVIVFRNKATGAELKRIPVNVTGNPGNPWARSNIVWYGSKLTFAVTAADNNNLIPANAQGVFFKWGSLVAISPVGNYSYDKIVFSPSTVTNTNNWSDITTIASQDIGTGYNVETDDFLGYGGGLGYNTSTNKGDICRYISSQPGWQHGKWRLPTAAEYRTLLGEARSVTNGSFSSDTSNNNEGLWEAQSGVWLGKGAANSGTRGTAATPGDATVYFPASGYRNSLDGEVKYTGEAGYIWSGSHYYGSDAFYLYAGSTGAVNTDNTYIPRPSAAPVRCIRDIN